MRPARRKLLYLHRARVLEDLKAPPGNQLEALGDRRGPHSIRINDQWRICSMRKDGDARDVDIVDYHWWCPMGARTKRLDPIPPGGILMEDFMRPLGLSINALARAPALPANRVSGIVNGNRAIPADTALRLGKYFGPSPETWLELHASNRRYRPE